MTEEEGTWTWGEAISEGGSSMVLKLDGLCRAGSRASVVGKWQDATEEELERFKAKS